jgi:hypothetical protein
LFSSDRNPNVVAPPPVIEKPKPMPPLPVVFGVMGLPSGTKAIMAEKAGGSSRSVKEGDSVGEFRIAKLDAREVTFEWEGKEITRAMEDVIDRSGPPQNGAPAAAPQPVNPAPAAAAAPPPPPPTRASGPGQDLTPTMKACAPNDPTPAGTVVDGYKKTVSQSIFGAVCRWLKQ